MSDLDRYLAPSQSSPVGEDPLVADLRQRQRQTASFNIVRDEGSPDQAGRANELSRRFGVPAETVERNLPQFEAAARQRAASPLLQDYPAIGRWAAEPRHAAVGRDDIQNLARISKAFRDYSAGREIVEAEQYAGLRKRLSRFGNLQAPRPPKANVGNFLGGIGNDFVQSLAITRASLRLQTADLVGNEEGTRRNLRDYERREGLMAAGQPAFKSGLMSGVYGGASSFVQSLPALAASVATANPAPVIAWAGARVETQSYGKYRARGGAPGESLAGATSEAIPEMALEILPMKFFVDSFGKAGVREFVGGMLVREIPTEQLTTIIQDAVDTAVANPDKTWAQYAAERPDAAYQTFISTVTQSLLGGGLGGAASLGRHKSAQNQANEAHRGARFLDELAKAAVASKVRQRDPDAFRQFIEMHSDLIYNSRLPKYPIFPPELVRALEKGGGRLTRQEEERWGALLDESERVDVARKIMRRTHEEELAHEPAEIYLPGDAIRELLQTDPELSGSPFWAERTQEIEEAYVTGGLIVFWTAA